MTSASIVGIALVGFIVDRHLNGNLRTLDITRALGLDTLGSAPVDGSDPMNLLVLGSDTRAGQGTGFGPNDHAGLSDTAMLVHFSAGRQGATVVSIPRDLLVTRPSCLLGNNTWSPPATGVQFNTALATGGPACSIRTAEQLTGLRVDHFVEIDFDGFVAMSDAVGGVEVCLPRAVHDLDSGLDLPAGPQLVTGRQALAFVRDRHGVGDGSDLARIQMQHQFLASLLQKAMSSDVLTTPTSLYRLADAATSAVTTDPALGSVQALVGLASSLRNISLDRVAFLTYPYVKDPTDLNRLLPDQQRDADLTARLGADMPVLPQPAPPSTSNSQPISQPDSRPISLPHTAGSGSGAIGGGAAPPAGLLLSATASSAAGAPFPTTASSIAASSAAALSAGAPLPAALSSNAPPSNAPPSAKALSGVPGVRIRVLNATGIPGLASRVADALRAGGATVAGVGNAPRLGSRDTVITYAPAFAADARAILQALAPASEGAPMRLLPADHGDTITVTLGGPYAAAPSANTAATGTTVTGTTTAPATAGGSGGGAIVPDRVASQDPCSGALPGR